MSAGKVYFGTPVSTEQACRAVLRMISSSVVGDTEKDSVPRTLVRLGPDGSIYHMLSSGEKRLVDLALSLWRAPVDADPTLMALGGLSMNNRRKVLIILLYRYLGRDALVDAEFDEDTFMAAFAEHG